MKENRRIKKWKNKTYAKFTVFNELDKNHNVSYAVEFNKQLTEKELETFLADFRKEFEEFTDYIFDEYYSYSMTGYYEILTKEEYDNCDCPTMK